MRFLLLLLLSSEAFGLNIVGRVGVDTRPVVVELMLLKAAEPQEIKMHIDTPGGSVLVMEEIYNVMKELKDLSHTFTCTIKRAYSAGFVIASMCDVRIAEPDASFMWHHAAYPYMGYINLPYINTSKKRLDKLQIKWDNLILESFIADLDIFKYIRDKEVYLTAEMMNKISPGYLRSK